jgi:hypothetical protein
MNMQNVRWPVLMGSMAVTLGLLLGIGFVFKNQTVDSPLKALYANTPVVASSEVTKSGNGYQIKVKLKDVPDLAAAYGQLNEETARVMKDLPYEIKVEDQRNEQLEQAYRRVNLYVHEALSTGRFADMADRTEAEAAKTGLKAAVAVDNDRVYVQLHAGDGYLYSVVERIGADAVKALRAEGGMGL